MPLSAETREPPADAPSFDDSAYDALRAEAVRRFEELVDQITGRPLNEPTLDGCAPHQEACRLAAISLLAKAHQTSFGADPALSQGPGPARR